MISNINKIYSGIGDRSKMLGKGAYGAVYRATRLQSKITYAVKVL